MSSVQVLGLEMSSRRRVIMFVSENYSMWSWNARVDRWDPLQWGAREPKVETRELGNLVEECP